MSDTAWTRFGTADLSNCEREQIHLAGSVQPHGTLFVLDPVTFEILHVSQNCERHVGVAAPELIGQHLADVSPGTPTAIRNLDPAELRLLPHPVPFATPGSDGQRPSLVGLVHENEDGRLILEIEPATEQSIDRTAIGAQLERLLGVANQTELFDQATRLIKDITGYDRVMIYQFDDDGHGEIVAERRRPDLESFLGNHYPASDIPQIARELYLRNRIRTLVDVNYEPVPLVMRGPVDAHELVMSLCQLRSMSPIHLQYLKNMGVGATLVASLVVAGQLWGLIACHHYSAKLPSHDIRAACELAAEIMSTRILALEASIQASVDYVVRRLEQRMVEGIGRSGAWIPALLDENSSLLQCVDATGAALVYAGGVHTVGDVPSTADLRMIARWISDRDFERVFATHRLARDGPFSDVADHAAGVLATRISQTPGELLLWFRPEQIRMVTWGGDPSKPVDVDGDDPTKLSPRKSFEAWHQLVEQTSTPWTKANRAAARAVGASVTDVVLQFRSLRLLMAHRQIGASRAQVEAAEAPLFIADGQGRCVIANQAFLALTGGQAPTTVKELSRLLRGSEEFTSALTSASRNPSSWRGRVELLDTKGTPHPVLLRADPIFDQQNDLIGTVFLFIDLRQKHEIESARMRFQQAVVQRRRQFQGRLATTSEESISLFNRILDNASIAALEVIDGVEVESVPHVLRSIESSMERASELLQHFAAGADGTGTGTADG